MARKSTLSFSARQRVVADRLHSVAIHLLRRLRVKDTASGMGPARLSALSVLVFGGPLSLKDLAAAEQVQPPTMSRMVHGLERDALVRREVVREDRRKIRLRATPKGIRILQQGRRRRIAYFAEHLRNLKGEELASLEKAADIIHRVLQQF